MIRELRKKPPLQKMNRLFRRWRICCGSSVLIASVCLILVSMYSISSISKAPSRSGVTKSVTQFYVGAPMASCTVVRDNYYFLDAFIVNQPELIRFIEDMQRDVEQEWSFEMTKSAIAFQHKQHPIVKILVRKLVDKTADYQILLPFTGQFLQTDQRTIAFVRIKSTLQIALNGSMVFIPSYPRVFLQRFKRGYFIDCKQPANSKVEPEAINKYFVDDLASVRDFFELIGAMFYLEAGSLLGWYRDCAIIEHTTDMDISVPIEYYTAEFRWNIFNNDFFRVWRQWGRENDSLEFATFLGPFGRGEKLDIFFNYKMPNYSFIGGWAPPDYLLWYKLPKRNGYCSGDLYGQLFAVPCNIEEWLSATYGDAFMTKQAAAWERENGTYGGAINDHIIGRYNESEASETFFF